jgi:antitoxin FitA
MATSLAENSNKLTVVLPDEQVLKLQELATTLGTTPAELVRLSIEDLLSGSDQDFQQATQRVLTKNAELYKRLA